MDSSKDRIENCGSTLQSPNGSTTRINSGSTHSINEDSNLKNVLSPSRIICTNSDNKSNDNEILHSVEEFDEIKQIFDNKFPIIEKWLRERAPHEIVSRLHETTAFSSKLRTSSVTSDLFQQWLATSPVQVIISSVVFFFFFVSTKEIF